MGIEGSSPTKLLPSPEYIQALMGQGLGHGYVGPQGLVGPALVWPSSAPLASYRPAVLKMDWAVKKLCAQMPMKVAQKILSIELHEETKEQPIRIIIRYDNQRDTVIFDVDAFPSDAHIGRIMMECP